MPRARRARNKVSDAVVEFEKEVEAAQKELKLRFDTVIQNGELPSDQSDHLFRTMLAYALGPEFDLSSAKRKRVVKDKVQSRTTTSKRRNAGRGAKSSNNEPVPNINLETIKPIISVSSDDEPEPSPSPLQKKSRRKKAISVVEISDTPVSKKGAKRKRAVRDHREDEPADRVAMEVEPVTNRTTNSVVNKVVQEIVNNERETKKGKSRSILPKKVAEDESDMVAVHTNENLRNTHEIVQENVVTVVNAKSAALATSEKMVSKSNDERVSGESDNSEENKENRFTVSKDGKPSDDAINRFKKPVAMNGKPTEGASKSIRLFKPVLRPKTKRAQPGMKEKRTESEMRLAAKTPGMSKLIFGNEKAATSLKAAPTVSNDVTADVIALSLKSPARNARKKISFAAKPIEFGADPLPSSTKQLNVNDNEDQDKIMPGRKGIPDMKEADERDQIIAVEEIANEGDEIVPVVKRANEGVINTSAAKDNKAQDVEDGDEIVPDTLNEIAAQKQKQIAAPVEKKLEPSKKLSIEPLFPPSIFAAPSPAPKKKTISFAPGTKKRGSDSLEPADASGTAPKRVRPATLTGKSDLRKRIDSMRERMSQKSMETPGIAMEDDKSMGPASQETNSSGFYSANSRAKNSQSEEDEEMQDLEKNDKHPTPLAGTAPRALSFQFEQSPTPERSLSIKTPARALEERFNAASPDNDVAKSVIVPEKVQENTDGDAMMKSMSASSSQEPGGSGVLSNLMTSVKSFLPTTMAIPGFQTNEKEETEELKVIRLEKERKLDEERREAETLARREAAKQVRQAEAREKQRRVEEKRKALEREMRRKEQEKKQKEMARTQRQRQEIEERKRRKAEEDRKRELRRQRVREHQEKVAAEEAAKRAELEKKLAAARLAQAAKYNPKLKIGGSSKAPMSERKPPMSAKKGQATPGAQRQLFRKKSVDVTSYEMSADRDRGNHSDDSSSESEEAKARRKGKKIPEWAMKNNISKAVNEQRTDPDKHFTRIQGVNLEDVFASTNQQKMRYRSRNSSGQWTKDRLTAKEEMEYKKKSGYI